jgi:dihydrofolate synthase/folylpolyglutamate synthase
VEALARAMGIPADRHGGVGEALACARAAASPAGAPVVVAGSLYLVGEARGLLGGA